MDYIAHPYKQVCNSEVWSYRQTHGTKWTHKGPYMIMVMIINFIYIAPFKTKLQSAAQSKVKNNIQQIKTIMKNMWCKGLI